LRVNKKKIIYGDETIVVLIETIFRRDLTMGRKSK